MFSWFNLLFFILFKCKCHHLTDRWQSLRVNFRHYKIHHKKIRLVFFVLERKVVNVIWIHVNTLRRLVNFQVSANVQIVFNLLAVNVLIDGISVTIYFSTKSTRIYRMCFTFAENFDKIPRPNVIHDNDTHTHIHMFHSWHFVQRNETWYIFVVFQCSQSVRTSAYGQHQLNDITTLKWSHFSFRDQIIFLLNFMFLVNWPPLFFWMESLVGTTRSVETLDFLSGLCAKSG